MWEVRCSGTRIEWEALRARMGNTSSQERVQIGALLLKRKKLLGEGRFAQVWLVKEKKSKVLYACKVLNAGVPLTPPPHTPPPPKHVPPPRTLGASLHSPSGVSRWPTM